MPEINPINVADPEPVDVLTAFLVGKEESLEDYVPAFTSLLPFPDFMEDCRLAYDYANRRILLQRGAYQYTYSMETKSWHKVSYAGLGQSAVGVLNSYPDCLMVACDPDTGAYHVHDVSVRYDGTTTQQTLPGLIVTRCLDLDAPEVRKTIRDIRIRGMYKRGNVRYILLASMDGQSWLRAPSLRNGSYRYYRLVIVSKMKPWERITYVDIDYETRLNNRMR